MNKVIEVSVLVTNNKKDILSLLDKKIDDVLLGKESRTYTEIVSGGKHLICEFSPKVIYQTIINENNK